MCGLVGWITSEKGQDSFDRRKFFEQALIADTIRGGDATGCFLVKRDFFNGAKPFADWCKQVGGGHEFVIGDEFVKRFADGRASDYKFAVGHNRLGTLGGKDNVDAAHPFTEGPITLVHNGTVNEGEVSAQRISKGFVNDSQTICHMLTTQAPEDVIKTLQGAFALIWHDARDDSLNFVRNKERPLHMAKSQGHDTIYFASEAELLFWLNSRLSLKLQDIVSLKPAHWLKFVGPKLMVPEVKEVELYTAPKVSASTWTAGQWSQRVGMHTTIPATIRSHKPEALSVGTSPTYRPSGSNTGTKKKVNPESGFNVPLGIQEDLLDLDLYVDEAEEFIAVQGDEFVWKADYSTVSVYGWIIPNDVKKGMIPCRLDGVSRVAWQNCRDRMWTVRPLGVVKLNWNLPCVVARLVATLDLAKQMTAVPEGKKPPKIDSNTTFKKIVVKDYDDPLPPFVTDAMDSDGPAKYNGPGGQLVTRAQWYIKTSKGCIDCANDIHIDDHEETQWVNDGQDPMCKDCAAVHAEEPWVPESQNQIIPPNVNPEEFAE